MELSTAFLARYICCFSGGIGLMIFSSLIVSYSSRNIMLITSCSARIQSLLPRLVLMASIPSP